MGIELKTKHGSSLQTLFSRTPCRYVQDDDRQGFFERHSYYDPKRNRRALYTSFGSTPDSLGFSLRPEDEVVQVVRDGVVVLEYDSERLEEALLSKHSQTAFLSIAPTTAKGREACEVNAVSYCKWPSIIRFLRLVSAGDVFLDLTMSEKLGGRIDDHGFLWRVRSESLGRLYLHSEAVDLVWG